jgi:REP element-mobilizing transposase RayT
MLPDGSIRYVQPFHVSLEGMETAVLCRDDADYDAFVKIICVTARRKNVIIIIYAVVSNHSHVAVLAKNKEDAENYGEEVKRVSSMWLAKRYGERGKMQKVDVKALPLDSDWYLRNALAYIPRNALDNGCNVNDYPWSGYRAMFRKEPLQVNHYKKVSQMRQRERRAILHTADVLSDVPWLVDADGSLVPESFCDVAYLEQAFNHDQVYFIRTIGSLNSAEMKQKLVDAPRTMMPDPDFYSDADAVAIRWFRTGLSSLSLEQKIRLIPYLKRTRKTTISQLARVFGLKRDKIESILLAK